MLRIGYGNPGEGPGTAYIAPADFAETHQPPHPNPSKRGEGAGQPRGSSFRPLHTAKG
jgi:hypothetical protein